MMKMLLVVACVSVSLLVCPSPALGKVRENLPPSAPLRIGVRHRPTSCPRESKPGDRLSMHYEGRLVDGTEFDSSRGRGEPFQFTLGQGMVIQGWDRGLVGMCEGEKRTLTIPSDLGYGPGGSPPKIPGGATLIFDVELMKIEDDFDPAAEGDLPPGFDINAPEDDAYGEGQEGL